MRKLISTISITALVLSQVVMASAQTTAIVTNSGDHLDVDATSTQNTNVLVTNNNFADVTQTSKSVNDTGHNTANGNITVPLNPCNPCQQGGGGAGTTIQTGNATSLVNQGVTANSNNTGISLPSGTNGAANYTNVVNTGKYADIDTKATTNTNVLVTNNNTALVAQDSFSKNNSGYNTANKNIGGGVGIMTGNAGSVTNQNVNVNSNATLVVVQPGTPSAPCGACGGTGGAGNSTFVTNTGSHLDVDTKATTNMNVEVVNSNLLVASQKSGSFNNSGHNNVSSNVGGVAGVLTGDAMSLTNQDVAANRNQTAIVLGESAMPLGGAFLDLLNTGSHADLDVTAKTNTNLATINDNTLLLGQTQWNHSSSGYNYSSWNVGSSVTATGGAGSGTNQNTLSNSNNTIFGDLLGLLGGWSWMGWL